MIEIKKIQATQQVLKQPGKKQHQNVYYVPGYLRLKTKNFIELDLQNLKGGLNATLIFTIYYNGLPQQIVKQLQSQIVFNFGRDQAKQLTKENNLQVTLKNNKQKSQIQFSIRQIFQLRLETDVFFSPFQIINFILSVTVQPVVIKGWGTVKVNLMDNQSRIVKTSYSSDQTTFGIYDLAEKKMASFFTNQRACDVKDFYKSSEQRQKQIQKKLAKIDQIEAEQKAEEERNGLVKSNNKVKINHFQYGHFLIPLYRHPFDSLASIFFPIWLLAIINLGIFFQDSSMSGRIVSVVTIMIAYVALIPVIRENIPPSSNIVLIEYLVYLNSLKNLFVVIDSVIMRNKGPDYEFIWQESGLFLVSLIITLLSVFVVIVMLALHYLKWKDEYKVKSQEQQGKFIRQQWSNKACQIYFTWINAKLDEKKQKTIEIISDRLPPLKSKKIL